MSKLDIHERAENYMYAKVQAATNELKDAERWDGRGWTGIEDWKNVYENQVKYCKRRVEVTQYILTKLYD